MLHRIQGTKHFQDYVAYLKTTRLVLLLLAAATPSLCIIYLVARYGVDIPFADEWTFAPMFVKAHDHTLGLADLFAQHNEHRPVFPRLLMIGIARAAHGNVRAQMFFSIALAIGTAFNVGWILRRSFRREKLFLLIILSNLLLFSLVQEENWIWGFQLCLFLVTFLLTTGVSLATSQLAIPTKFAACFAIAFAATFSFGNGALLWLVTFPIALFVTEKPNSLRNLPWLFAWIAGATCTITLYLFHYVKPAHHPPLAASRHLLDYYFYVAGFLGANLAPGGHRESLALPVLLGTVLSAIYFLTLLGIRASHKSVVWREAAPWLAIAGFAVISSGIAAVTRIGFGVSQALDSRYTTLSLLFSVALIALVAISSRELRSTFSGRAQLLDWVSRTEGACLTLFVITVFASATWGIEQMRAVQRARLWGKGALHFASVLNDERIYQTYLGGYGPDVLKFAKMENSIGYLHPAMRKSAVLSDAAAPQSVPPQEIGFIDRLIPSQGPCVAHGWAVLPRKARVADCVILASESQTVRRFAFAVNDGIEDRPDVTKVLNRPDLLRCGWHTHFGRSSIPTGEHQITAWAFDANSGVLYQLGGKIALR